MLVLINQEVLDVGDPATTLQALGVGDARAPSRARLVQLGQDAAFAAAGLENAHPAIRQTLAAYLGLRGEANCALFLCPPRARSPRDVGVRLGMAPITTMAFLYSAQQNGRLTSAMVNAQVWRVAGGHAAA